MDTQTQKEVYYDKFCKTCEHKGLDETKEPCNKCLNETLNWNSHKPVEYEKGKK